MKYRKDQKDEAMRLLRSVVKEKPELLEGHYYLATVLFQKNDLTAARAEYLAADALAGSDTRPLLALCEMEQLQQTAELPCRPEEAAGALPQGGRRAAQQVRRLQTSLMLRPDPQRR